jgi:hypothetical protein
MDPIFSVDRIALHFVDRRLSEPKLAKREVALSSFTREEDISTLNRFFDGHLTSAWKSDEGRVTLAASFSPGAFLQQYHKDLSQDPNLFFTYSCEIAKRLHNASRGTRASPGVLMALLFHEEGDGQHYLGLFKMDPGTADKVTLVRDHAGEVLLDLAVQHIEQSFPDPDDKVLKWAIIPHPTRLKYDLKVKDEQGGADPAQYFMSFLGCAPGLSEKKQVAAVLDHLAGYTAQHHPQDDVQGVIEEVLEELVSQETITTETLVDAIKHQGGLTDFDESVFRQSLAEAQVGEVSVTPAIVRAVKVQYSLPSGITIKGPRAAIEKLVEIVQIDGGYEFRIRTPNYERDYV